MPTCLETSNKPIGVIQVVTYWTDPSGGLLECSKWFDEGVPLVVVGRIIGRPIGIYSSGCPSELSMWRPVRVTLAAYWILPSGGLLVSSKWLPIGSVQVAAD